MPVVGFIGGLGATELGLILLIVLILFGAGRLPQVFEAFGKGLKSFRDAQKDGSIDVSDSSTKGSIADQSGANAMAEEAEELKQRV